MLSVLVREPEVEMRQEDDGRELAARTLRRLVGFVAGAFDAQYAFIAALEDPCHLAVWAARSYGLSLEEARLSCGAGPEGSLALPSYLDALRRIWPAEAGLLALTPAHCVSTPLLGSGGIVRGHLGFLDAGSAARCGSERLHSLACLAAAELEVWSEGAPGDRPVSPPRPRG